MKCPSSMISSAARKVPNACCVFAGMLYEEPACRSSACATHVGSRTISSKIARFTASPMEMPFGSDAIARSASMRPLSAVSVSAGTVAAVTSAAFSRPIAGSRCE